MSEQPVNPDEHDSLTDDRSYHFRRSADRIDARIEQTDFESPTSTLSSSSRRWSRASNETARATSRRGSREGVQDRLQSLGYLEE